MSVLGRRILQPTESAPVERREWMLALAAAFLLILLMLIPYALGTLTARPGTVATGLIMNPEDSQSYFAKMLQGYDGRWLYTIPFTTEAQEGVFLGTVYLALGHLARVGGLSLEMTWHLARVAADLLMFLVVYWFIAGFVKGRRQRQLAYLLALFGSGLGWLLFLLGQPYWLGAFPVDFKMLEAHLFFTAFTNPHMALGTALLLVSLRFTWDALKSGGEGGKKPWRPAVAAGVSNLLLVIAYPFLIYVVFLTTVLAYGRRVVRQRRLLWGEGARLALTLAIPAPLVLYYAYVLQTNEVFRAWSEQSVTASPPWPHYLLAFGPYLLLGALSWRRQQEPRQALLWMWLLAAALLLYAPVAPQRRFVQGLQVPLSILAVAGLSQVAWPWLQERASFRRLIRHPRYSAQGLARFLSALFLLFMSLSNLYLLASVSVTAAVQQPYPLFRPEDEVQATGWLRENSDRSAVVLGAYQTGNYVAAHAGNPVVIGHWTETMDFERKRDEVQRFFAASTSHEWRRRLLQRYGVAYVWVGPQERAVGGGNTGLDDMPFLDPVHRESDVTIYRVNLP